MMKPLLILLASPLLASVCAAQPTDTKPQFAPRKLVVAISGEVNKAGAYEVAPGETFSSLLKLSGGAMKGANLQEVFLHRAGTNCIVELWRFEVGQGETPDLVLQDGDIFTVSVGRPDSVVYVVGSVAQPGYYSIPTKKPLLVKDALALAGGLIVQKSSTRSNSWSRFLVVRNGQRTVVNDEELLHTGDVLYVTTGLTV